MKPFKTSLFLLLNLLIATSSFAQKVERAIQVNKAGTLVSQLTLEEANSITHLTLTGKINAVDFRHLRDEFTQLQVLDLSAVKITSYMGKNGTLDGFTIYTKNSIPAHAFSEKTDYDPKGKPSLRKIILSYDIKSIDKFAFANCPHLFAIISTSGTAPKLAENALSPQRTAIFVPAGSKNNYIAKEPWSQFAIIEGEPIKLNLFLDEQTSLADQLSEKTIQPHRVNYLTLNGSVSLDDLQLIRNYMIDLVYVDLRNTDIQHIPDYTFAQRVNLLTVHLPSNLKSIGIRAFDNCNKMGPELVLPASLSSIEHEAFIHCNSLQTLRALGSNITALSDNIFGEKVKSKIVYRR